MLSAFRQKGIKMQIKNISDLSGEERKKIMNRGRGLPDVEKTVMDILEDVRANGDRAVLAYAEKFDKVKLDSPEVSDDEKEEALASVNPEVLKHLEKAADNIRRFHEAQLPRKIWYIEETPGVRLGQKATPLARVGCYVPGGRASYPSTVLMTAIPAKVAGVSEIVICTPPMADGRVNPLTIAAARIAGADRIFKTGGAQAIGAMAYGTETIPKVDKIVGPGNVFVTTAKMKIREEAEIDFPAGPSEVLIIADSTADVRMTAADIIAQAEHDPNSISVMVTTSADFAGKVLAEAEEQAKNAVRREIIEKAFEHSIILVGKTIDECVAFSNEFAPEHLQIMVDTLIEDKVLDEIRNAGSVFVGYYAPVPAGDYCSGTNHVLPTAAYAKMYSGLNVNHFLKFSTIQKIDKKGLEELSETIITLAEEEGLFGHAQAVRMRFRDD